MEESSGKWQVLGFAESSGFGACAHNGRLIRVDVAAGELHVAAVDPEAAALPEEWRSLSEGWDGVRSAFERLAARRTYCHTQVHGKGEFSSACSGFGACAHAGRLVRVDVAAGELHVAAGDVEAAALPEEWCSLSEAGKAAGNGLRAEASAFPTARHTSEDFPLVMSSPIKATLPLSMRNTRPEFCPSSTTVPTALPVARLQLDDAASAGYVTDLTGEIVDLGWLEGAGGAQSTAGREEGVVSRRMRVLCGQRGAGFGLDVPPGTAKAKATVHEYGSKLRQWAERARGGTGRRGLLRVLLVGDLREHGREERLLLRGR
eukprot:gene1255-biopygen1800